MSWRISGQSLELCSCKLLCPCWLGPEGEPDEGWCAAVLAFDVREGESDGVDLGGTTVVLTANWPGNFFAGEGKARLYIDESASAEQSRELEGIFRGQKGGHLEGLWGAIFDEWLPTLNPKIELTWGDNPGVSVAEIGKITMQPITDGDGRAVQVSNTVTQAGLHIGTMDLASSKGSTWFDPDLRRWDGDSGTLHSFEWSA